MNVSSQNTKHRPTNRGYFSKPTKGGTPPVNNDLIEFFMGQIKEVPPEIGIELRSCPSTFRPVLA